MGINYVIHIFYNEKMKYNPIGASFKEGKVILVAKESKDNGKTCTGCWYTGWKNVEGKRKRNYPYGCFTHGHVCTPYYRKDKKHVIFEKVNDI